MGQTDPVEGRKWLHGACHFDCKEGRNKKKGSPVGLSLTFPQLLPKFNSFQQQS